MPMPASVGQARVAVGVLHLGDPGRVRVGLQRVDRHAQRRSPFGRPRHAAGRRACPWRGCRSAAPDHRQAAAPLREWGCPAAMSSWKPSAALSRLSPRQPAAKALATPDSLKTHSGCNPSSHGLEECSGYRQSRRLKAFESMWLGVPTLSRAKRCTVLASTTRRLNETASQLARVACGGGLGSCRLLQQRFGQHRREQYVEFGRDSHRRPPPARSFRRPPTTTRGTPSARPTSSSRVVKVFTDAVRAGDLKAAQDAFAPSRMPWERIEPIAGLVEDTDGKTDSRVDDFANVDDPTFTGWHRLEYLLFEKNTTEGGAPFADQLDKDIATLKKQLPTRRGQADRRGQRRGRAHRRGVRRASSPARRIATPRPTCGTSTPTCRVRRSPSTS